MPTDPDPRTFQPGTGPLAGEPNVIERLVSQLGDRVRGSASVELAFGPERIVGDRTLIPVARVAYGFGAGGGVGRALGPRGAAPETDRPLGAGAAAPDTAPASLGEGGGAGAGVSVTPVAVIEVTSERVRIRPIPDLNRLLARALLLVAFLALLRTLRRR